VPFVVTSHGADLHALRGKAMERMKRFVLGRAAEATVVSRAMRDVLSKLGSLRTEACVMPMGVDMTRRFVPGPAAARSSHEILFVGRLVERKGLRFLIDAMPAILASHPLATLTIVGFGPEEAGLRARAAELGVARSVQFKGALS